MSQERATDQSYLELSTEDGDTLRVLKKPHPRSRRMRLTVTPKGARVSYPQGTHPAQLTAFVRQHVDWLARKLEELRLDARVLPALKVGTSTQMPLRGEWVDLVWAEGPYPRIELRGGQLQLTVPRPHTRALPVARGLIASFLEAQIRRDVGRWMPAYIPALGAAPTSVRIRPLKSLWGSLDTRDRVNLDLALALAPPAALRYVLVHELCHLKVRNHSAKFWKQVAALMDDYQAQRDWLRLNGGALKAEVDRLIADVAD
ncbi:YgjP-like metallopeptidase domain-containing protein [Oleiagrimonas sp. C23AA]|uniref:M48 family metallopeptidase n=1 Tax=Oleiagrimonas sp. C23AA TaxID=2719047 RepID=UPI00141E8D44|nr:YgjP-like metallopeptidase domain-containing protein [Oleiagrimonas sp. C23AA]NII10761.1 M48 family metallopeptidase [Oleiagrimonas sp. C23AA]